MTEKEEEKFLKYLENQVGADTSHEKLMCIVSTTDEQLQEYLNKRYPDYEFLLQVQSDYLKNKVRKQDVALLLRKIDYIEDMFPSIDRALCILNLRAKNLSCPIFKTKDGKIVPLYQLENYDWD